MMKRSFRLTAAFAVMAVVFWICMMSSPVFAGPLMYDGTGGVFTGTGDPQTVTFTTPDKAYNGWAPSNITVNDEDNYENIMVMPVRFQVTKVTVGAAAYQQAYSDSQKVNNLYVDEPVSGQHGILMMFKLTNTGTMPVSPNYMQMIIGGSYTIWYYKTGYTAYVQPGKSMTYYLYANVSDAAQMIPQLSMMVNNGSSTGSNYTYFDFPLEISSGPEITKHPCDTTITAADTVTFSVQAKGEGTLTYQWQSRQYYDSAWTNSGLTGARTNTLTIPGTPGLSGWEFRCIVTDGNGKSAYSETAFLTVMPAITSEPKNTAVEVGQTAKFSVTAAGKAKLTYQWQSRKDANSAWANSGQTGAKTANLSVSTTAGLHGWQFRCVVTDGNAHLVYSNPATLTVKPAITTQPQSVYAAAGTTAKFSIVASGKAKLTYQWQSRKNASAEWANSGQAGAKTPNLSVTVSAGLHGWQFRCIVTDGNGQQTASNPASIMTRLGVATQPQNKSVIVGDTVTYTVKALGKGTLTYQWQSRKDANTAWSNSGLPGAKTTTLSVTASAGYHGYQFRCIIKDSAGSVVASNIVTVTVLPKITAQPVSQSVKVGSTAQFTVTATGKATLKYQWQSRKNASSEWANSGQTGAKTRTLSLTATAGLNGWQFRCVITDGNGQKNYSDPVTLTVK